MSDPSQSTSAAGPPSEAVNLAPPIHCKFAGKSRPELRRQPPKKIYPKLGWRRPETEQSLNNLAALFDSMGDYAKAEPLYQRALKIYEKALGPDHQRRHGPQQSGESLSL